jgi:hypothetical protein
MEQREDTVVGQETDPIAQSPDEASDASLTDEVEETNDLGGKVKRTASRMAGSVSSVVKQALVSRDHVLMVRVNDEALNRIMDLKDADLFRSRSEAAAYLIAEGIEAKQELFDRIGERIRQIQDIKEELRTLAGETGVDPSSDQDAQQ